MPSETLPPDGFALGDLWCIDRKRGVYYNRDEGIVSLGDQGQAERAGAIVRKAEVPTSDPSTVVCPACQARPGMLCRNVDGRAVDMHMARIGRAEAAAEQPSGNTGGLPTTCKCPSAHETCPSCDHVEAPAAPVAEPTADSERMEALRAIVDSNNGKHAAIAERDARIAALEDDNQMLRLLSDEASEAAKGSVATLQRRISALEAELAEAKALYQTSVTAFGEMHKRLTANRAAAVQAERERCLAHVELGIKLWDSEDFNAVASAIKNGDPAP